MNYKIKNPVRLIELFSGIGAQYQALENLGVDFKGYATSEWEVNAVASYKAMHCPDDNINYDEGFSVEEIEQKLLGFGVSTDGKKPLTKQQLKRKSEVWKRNVFNNFRATNNIGSIINAKGSDLGIVDTDKYTYIVSYSYPCTSISLAGKKDGMVEGSGTASSLLWEVKRLLSECADRELPQVLLMENVSQVHSKKNITEFEKWIAFLEELGYKNYWQDMNAKDYGVAQSRNRCFMISILSTEEGDYEFPEPIPLKYIFADYLEDSVEEKFYLKGEKPDILINKLIDNGVLAERELQQTDQLINQILSKQQTASLQEQIEESQTTTKKEMLYLNYNKIDKVGATVAKTLCARDYKGFGTGFDTMNGVLEEN